MRCVEFEADGGGIDADHPAGFAAGGHVRDWRGHDVLVAVKIVEPEHEVVGGERRAVTPFHAAAQEQRGGPAVGGDFVGAGHRGRDLAAGQVPE